MPESPRAAAADSPSIRASCSAFCSSPARWSAVVGIVAAADTRTLVYAAAGAFAPGDRIDAGDLVERSVALDGSDPLYLAPGDLPDGRARRDAERSRRGAGAA